MKSILEHIRENLCQRLKIDPLPAKIYPHELVSTEWSQEFERLQRNRMFMGALRYGRLGAAGKPQYDRCTDIKRRVSKYKDTGNLEYLVDAANLCQCEFVEGDHPNKHFSSADDGEHTKAR